jgi:hypothetical protein
MAELLPQLRLLSGGEISGDAAQLGLMRNKWGRGGSDKMQLHVAGAIGPLAAPSPFDSVGS